MRTRALLIIALLSAAAAGRAADDRHPLARALDYDTNVLLVVDLRPTNLQLTDLLTASRAAVRLAEEAEGARAAALESAQDLMEAERQALAKGEALSEEQKQALEELRAGEVQRQQRLYSAVDAEIRRLRRALAPEQAALIDFSRPADAAGAADPAEAVDELHTLSARLSEALRFIERQRYLLPDDYVPTRVARTDEYLRRYYRPNSPEALRARDDVIALLNDARAVKERDWPQEAPVLAAQLLQRIGVLSEERPDRGGNRARYGWWNLYDLLTDPQTPQLLQSMLAAQREQ